MGAYSFVQLIFLLFAIALDFDLGLAFLIPTLLIKLLLETSVLLNCIISYIIIYYSSI